jgi:hypothetical protein
MLALKNSLWLMHMVLFTFKNYICKKSREFQRQENDQFIMSENQTFFGTMFQSSELIKTIFHQSGDYDLVSPIFDLTFLGSNNVSGLNNVTIEFYPIESNVNVSMNNSVCLSWSETGNGFTMTTGCSVEWKDDDVIVCTCDGPGIFAAGFSSREVIVWTGSFGALYLNFAFLALAILIFLACLVCIVWKKR